jgi:hypothetical protein
MLTLALLLAAAQAGNAAAQAELPSAPEPAPPAPCAEKGGLLPGSGLCRADALTRLPHGTWTPPQGCEIAAQETPLTGGRWLLYAALRCGEKIARLAVTPQQGGALELRYDQTARNAALLGQKALTIVEGRPAADAAIYTLAQSALPRAQAQRCALRVPPGPGYPRDGYVFDLPAAEARQSAALDQPCGPYGRSAWQESYWRLTGSIGVFTHSGGEKPEFDPASLAVYKP